MIGGWPFRRHRGPGWGLIGRWLFGLAGVAAIGAGVAEAQIRPAEDQPVRRRGDRREPAMVVLAGPVPYDIGTSGTGFVGGVRFELPSGRRLIVEPGIAYFRYTSETNTRISYLLPEVSLQLDAGRGAVRPFAGAGAGLAEFASGPGGGRGTVHAVAGLRLQPAGRVGARFEGRVRSIDPLGSPGTMLEIAAGLRIKLGDR